MRSAVLILAWGTMATAQVSERAAQLHREAFVFDGHVHVINRQLHDGTNIGDRLPGGQVDLPRMLDGGLDAVMFSIFVPERYYPPRLETRYVLRLLELAHRQVEANRDRIGIAHSAGEIEELNRAGRLAAVLDLEGGFDLDGDPAILRSLYRLGLRMIQLPAHNWANSFADSYCAPAKWDGLNEKGRELVREMNRLGILINVSHASDATIEQVLEISTRPIIASHHGLRRRNNIPRNMPDDLLRKLAATGGVIGIQIGNEFHNRKMFEWRTARAGRAFWDTSAIGKKKESEMTMEEVDQLTGPRFPMVGTNAPDDLLYTPEEWIDVVEEAMAIAGEDHVALGSDFDGGPTPPRGMHDIADLPQLTEAMLRCGWPEERIRKFLGGNLLRVFREATSPR